MPDAAATAPAGADAATDRSVAQIDLSAISANVRRLAALTATPVMAVVKADGYGHGLIPAARAAVAGGAAWLATAFVEEAMALRAAGIDEPLLALITTTSDDLVAAAAAGIDLGVGTPSVLARVPAGARIHLEIDTGLSRGGATPSEWGGLVRSAAGAPVEIVAIWSHLACADEPGNPANAAQLAAYRDALATAARLGVRPQLRHLANSAAALTMPEARYDVLRAGIACYGVAPGPAVRYDGFTPAMTLVSHLARVKAVPSGVGVSYGHTYRVPAATTLGVVPLGYGDGVPRHASGVGSVLVGGTWRPILGRVCMDQFVVDLGGEPVAEGTPVTVFGPPPAPSADDLADVAGTIGYEIVTRVGARVPRRYVRAHPATGARLADRPAPEFGIAESAPGGVRSRGGQR